MILNFFRFNCELEMDKESLVSWIDSMKEPEEILKDATNHEKIDINQTSLCSTPINLKSNGNCHRNALTFFVAHVIMLMISDDVL